MSISCHVLDTTKGRPAQGVRVRVRRGASGVAVAYGTTDADGRIKTWTDAKNAPVSLSTGDSVLATTNETGARDGSKQKEGDGNGEGGGGEGDGEEEEMYTLVFEVGTYFTDTGTPHPFFPVVEVTFTARRGERYHVPLLVSPYAYSTYRGS